MFDPDWYVYRFVPFHRFPHLLTQLILGNHQALLPSPRNHHQVVTYPPNHLRLLPNLIRADGVPFHSEVVDLGAFAKSLDLGRLDLSSKHHHHHQ